MMGIDVNRTISFTFLIAGALAGAAGVIYALYFTTSATTTGFQLGLIAFTAAVLGGIGNLPGAVLGALLIGFIQAFNEGLSLARAGLRLDALDRLRDPDPDPRLPPAGPPRRADAGGRRLMARRDGRRGDRGWRLLAAVGLRRCRARRWDALPRARPPRPSSRSRCSVVPPRSCFAPLASRPDLGVRSSLCADRCYVARRAAAPTGSAATSLPAGDRPRARGRSTRSTSTSCFEIPVFRPFPSMTTMVP